MDFLGRAKTLVRIVEAGSFSAAARSLGMSLAAISRQVATLEEELGAKLIVRTTRTLRLTDEGRRFHEHATRLVREADAARASVRPDRAVSGTVVVSASVTLGVLRIVPSMPALLARHAGLQLELRLEDRTADLVSEGVDIAIRAGLALPDSSNLVGVEVATFERVLVASPEYLRNHGVPKNVASLANHGSVLGPTSSSTWQFIEDGESRTVTAEPKLRVATLLGVKAAALAGIGMAILPDFAVLGEIADRSLRVVLPDAKLAPVSSYALYRVENRGVPRIDATLAHLRETIPLDARRSTPRTKRGA